MRSVRPGVYRSHADGVPEFIEVAAPTEQALHALLQTVIARLHVAQNEHARRRSAIDGRTNRHESYRLSQVIRKRTQLAPPAGARRRVVDDSLTVRETEPLVTRIVCRRSLEEPDERSAQPHSKLSQSNSRSSA
jgi:acyl transferase domain-containing protein